MMRVYDSEDRSSSGSTTDFRCELSGDHTGLPPYGGTGLRPFCASPLAYRLPVLDRPDPQLTHASGLSHLANSTAV